MVKRCYICTRYQVFIPVNQIKLLINRYLFQFYFFVSNKKGFIFAPLLLQERKQKYVH